MKLENSEPKRFGTGSAHMQYFSFRTLSYPNLWAVLTFSYADFSSGILNYI